MTREEQELVRQLRSGLELACAPSYVPKIIRGREQVAALPRDWVLANIDRVAEECLDLNDFWEYRRLLELLVILEARDSLRRFVERGLACEDFEVREAAEDYAAHAAQ